MGLGSILGLGIGLMNGLLSGSAVEDASVWGDPDPLESVLSRERNLIIRELWKMEALEGRGR